MHDDSEHFDAELGHLADSVRSGANTFACLQLADFALKLDHIMRLEERAIEVCFQRSATKTNLLDGVKREHASLRRLVALLASALDRADDRRALEVLGKLRSVLLLHVTKEEILASRWQH